MAATTKTKSKSAIVRQLRAKGMDSPTQISAEAKKLGYKISPGYVSLLKTLAKAKQQRDAKAAKAAKSKRK